MVLQSLAIAALMATSSPLAGETPELTKATTASDGTMYYRRYFDGPVPPGGLGPAVGESTDSCVIAGFPPEYTVVTNTTGTVTANYWENIIGSCPGGLL